MIVWNPGMDTGLLYSIDRWDETFTCDDCEKEGSYRIAGDHNSPGLCEEHLRESNKPDKDSNIKNVLQLVTLPYKHNYEDAAESKTTK